MSTHKSVHSLIVDTGPLIKNTVSISTILQSAEVIYTTPAILSEIKDATTRSRVETTLLPFLNIRNPTPASYQLVAAFSKKTGDFPVLSQQDLGILALAYEIDQERKRESDKTQGEKDQGDEKENIPQLGQEFEAPVNEVFEHTAAAITQDSEFNQADKTTSSPTRDERAPAIEPPEAIGSLETNLSTLQISATDSQESEDGQERTKLPELPEVDDQNDSDGEWITPSNLKKHQAKDSGVSLRESSPNQLPCATMTTDYAMQNVLLQLHLSLISPAMQRIQTLRTYILRCHACFLTTKDMTRQFCPRCGQPTLNRVSCTTNSKGEFKINLSKNFQWNNRGNKYSVPKPVAGTASGKGVKGGGKGGWGRDLVLTEDQKEYTRQISEQKRTKTRDLMDEDYLPSILSGDRNRAGGRPKVGAGKNVNSRKRF